MEPFGSFIIICFVHSGLFHIIDKHQDPKMYLWMWMITKFKIWGF